jgi:hypothetical protein
MLGCCEVMGEYRGKFCSLPKCAFCGDREWVVFVIDDKGGSR